jgi:vitamin B12 transporter
VGATSITIGASRQVEQMDVSTQYSTDSGNAIDKAIFVETITSLTDLLSVSAAARRTTSNDFGTNSSYRVSGVYNLTDTLILRATASSGFRAPSLYERFSTDYGNPDLEVEKSSTQEIGIEQTYASGSAVRLTLFKSKVDNLIDYKITDFDTYDGFYDQVDGSVKSEGIELSGEYKLNDALTFAGSYTYVESKNGKTRLNRIPGHDIALSLKTKLNPRTNADVTINHIKDYYDFGVKLPDYTVVNLSASYDVTDTLQGYVRVQNLMDADYETITDYNTGGRQMFAGVRASF